MRDIDKAEIKLAFAMGWVRARCFKKLNTITICRIENIQVEIIGQRIRTIAENAIDDWVV